MTETRNDPDRVALGTRRPDVAGSIRAVVERVVAERGLECYDLAFSAGPGVRTLEVVVDRSGGVDLDSITQVNRALSVALDAADVVDGAYVLEVSSPGVERQLRTPAHLRGAIGEVVSVRFRDDRGSDRVRGELAFVDDAALRVVDEASGSEVEVALGDVTKARTVFDWSPTPKPGKGSRPGRKSARPPAAGDPEPQKESAHR